MRSYTYYCMASIVVVMSFLVAAASSGGDHTTKPRRIIFNLVRHQPNIQLDDLSEDPLLLLYPMKGQQVMLVQFGIGEPPVEQYAIMDTGSHYRWLFCKSKYKLRQSTANMAAAVALYDPLKSSTYRSLPCGDPICPRDYYCPNPSAPCKHRNHYSSATLVGLLGYESFTFSTFDDGVVSVPSVFGCINPEESTRQISTDERVSGIFGLADFTFLSNVGGGHPRFSYCIGGDLAASNESHSHLQLGEDVELDGTITKLMFKEGNHLSAIVESVSIGDEDLNIDPLILIIDTGALLTFQIPKWYLRILEKIKDVMLKLGYSDMHHRLFELCYKGSPNSIQGFPGLQLHFQDENFQKPFVLNPTSLFIPLSNNSFCLAFKSLKNANILGLWAQQGYNVGFDLGTKKLYYYTVDCSDLI